MATYSRYRTRSEVKCPVFGEPHKLSENVLPTYEDMIKYYIFVKDEMKITSSSKEPTIKEISEKVALDISAIWTKASLPTISHKRIRAHIISYHSKYKSLLKSVKNNEISQHYQNVFKLFRNEAKNKLFDISTCKCEVSSCCCEKSRKVPVQEQLFLHDQRTVRKMVISDTVDKKSTNTLRKKIARKFKDQNRFSKLSKKSEKSSPVFYGTISNSSESDVDEDISLASSKTTVVTSTVEHSLLTHSPPISQAMRLPLPTLARECDRYGLSDRAAASLASAVLQDVGLVTEQDSSLVIDRNKIRREKEKKRHSVQTLNNQNRKLVQGLYFDGRKDKTIKLTNCDGKSCCKTEIEEHVTLVQEPESEYLGHVTPSSGKAKAITKSIKEFLAQQEIRTESIIAIGCDGTNVNTGRKEGVIRSLEVFLQKPVQWFVCQLHANELPLRHLMQYLDGTTSGPRSFSGIIGAALAHCETLTIIQFEVITTQLPEINKKIRKDLSTDQQYLYDICQAVSCGTCSNCLANREPGTLSHSRWLTTANRILRLYIATNNPTKNLFILAEFVMKVYAPMWFQIKIHHSCKDGAKHVFDTITKSRYLSDELKNVIDPVIQRNSYFGHPENILLTMITDDRKFVRELGLRRILIARKKNSRNIRKFAIPNFNFEATEYYEMIDWQNWDQTEPPITKGISEETLKQMVLDGAPEVLEFPKFPCHTQSVERHVKLVTEASSTVCGEAKRDGYIRVKLESRKLMPQFDSKKDYRQ